MILNRFGHLQLQFCAIRSPLHDDSDRLLSVLPRDVLHLVPRKGNHIGKLLAPACLVGEWSIEDGLTGIAVQPAVLCG